MIKRRRFSEDIADSVLEKVLNMGLKPGDRLPTHTQLSEMIGVSLPSLREGLGLLSHLGVINITHGAGTTLANPSAEDYFKMLAPVSKINRLNMDDLSSYCSLFIPDLAKVIIRKAESTAVLLETGLNNQSDFISFHKNFHSKLAAYIENPLKKSSFLIALNLFYTNPSISRISEEIIFQFLKAHFLLLESIKIKSRNGIESALGDCYKFTIPKEDLFSFPYYSFGTGSLGGSFYEMAKKFAAILSDDGLNIHPELTGGGIENIALTEEGKTILALTQKDITETAYRGEGLFLKKYSHLRIFCSVRPLNLWIITPVDRGITSLYDLKSRRIAMGAEGGDSGNVARTILMELEYKNGDYRPFYLSLSNAVHGLSNNELDVLFFLAHSIPSIVKDMAETQKIEFIQIPSKIINKIESKNPFWKPAVIKSEISEFKNKMTISVGTVLITNSDVPDNLVCRIASVLKNKSDREDLLDFNKSSNRMSVPFHKGVLECLK